MKTYEQIALDKLQEIQPATKREWATALGYKTPSAFHHTFTKLRKQELIINLNNNRIPAKYGVKNAIMK